MESAFTYRLVRAKERRIEMEFETWKNSKKLKKRGQQLDCRTIFSSVANVRLEQFSGGKEGFEREEVRLEEREVLGLGKLLESVRMLVHEKIGIGLGTWKCLREYERKLSCEEI